MENVIKTLEDVNINEIVTAFNQSFADYFIPFKLTEEQLKSKMIADKTELPLSVGVFEEDHLIAFILHGYDVINGEQVVYNGGTGVIPDKRGSRLSQKMYRFILPILKERGIDCLVLEVISENIKAIKSYKNSGFKTSRELLCYKGEASVSNPDNDLKISELRHYDWDLMTSFWDIRPTWQNSNNVLNELKHNNISLGAYFDNQLVGYIIYNPANKRIQQIGVSKDFRQKGIASTLLTELINAYDSTFSIGNVDKRSKTVNDFLQKIGLKIDIEQLEMKLQLDKYE